MFLDWEGLFCVEDVFIELGFIWYFIVVLWYSNSGYGVKIDNI